MSLALEAQKEKERAQPSTAPATAAEPAAEPSQQAGPSTALPSAAPLEEDLFDLGPESRPTSPLGELLTPTEQEGEQLDADLPKKFTVGPLPTLFSQENQHFPKIEPPSGWLSKVKSGGEFCRASSWVFGADLEHHVVLMSWYSSAHHVTL